MNNIVFCRNQHFFERIENWIFFFTFFGELRRFRAQSVLLLFKIYKLHLFGYFVAHCFCHPINSVKKREVCAKLVGVGGWFLVVTEKKHRVYFLMCGFGCNIKGIKVFRNHHFSWLYKSRRKLFFKIPTPLYTQMYVCTEIT